MEIGKKRVEVVNGILIMKVTANSWEGLGRRAVI